MSNNLIEIKGLNKFYGKNKKALNDINLNLSSGKIIGLLGPNGSGKTTLIKILNGLLKDYDGTIKIDGNNIGSYTKSIISYLPDESYFDKWMKVDDCINIFSDMYQDFDKDKALNLLKRLNIDNKMKIQKMSKGMNERFQLILVMSRQAKVYILDEPIGGVDPAAREVILEIILNNYNQDSLVIISTHLISDIEKIFDEIIFLKDGKVEINRNTEELREETGKSMDELFREVFRC